MRGWILAGAVAFVFTACSATTEEGMSTAALVPAEASYPTRSELEAALAPNASEEVRQALIERLPRVTFADNGVTRVRYVWEGDMLLTREQISALLASNSGQSAGSDRPELLLMVDELGRPVFWPRGSRDLTYWIDQSSFNSSQEFEAAVAAMATAAADWENSCAQCALTMRRVADRSAATFRVQYERNPVQFIASAFFPNDPLYRRTLLIAQGFYTSQFDRAGVLRHELGHVLGYRHEHIVGVRGCYLEDNRWVAVTPYDSRSVMHYPCGGGGSVAMALSPLDIAGHRAVYGR